MPHFFIGENDTVSDTFIVIRGIENYRHIARALRAKTGEKLLLIDSNQLQYETVIKKITSYDIECEIIKSYPSKRDLNFDLYLAQSPLRSDAQLTVIEKATELGVRGVYPVLTDNCAVNKASAIKKQEKWQKVMYEASKQCERAKIPTCYCPTTLQDVLDINFDRVIVFGERSTEVTLKNYLRECPLKKGDKLLVVIGPEGGFSEGEFNFFREKHLTVVSLGDLILKAETAVIAGLGNIIYEGAR